jgi:hypothetical protein
MSAAQIADAVARTYIYDTSTAFANAIATNRMVFIPSGGYKASFDLANSSIIEGEGARNHTTIIPPAGATYVVRIASNSTGTTSKQHCVIRHLSIQNPNAVANCTGILFDSSGGTGINDSHRLEDIYINGFNRGIKVLTRLIINTWINVEVDTCTRGIEVIADPAGYKFNLNTFIECRVTGCQAEGFYLTGYNTTNIFIGCDIENNNSLAVAGVAGMYWEDAESLIFDGAYFENNGGSVAIDAGTPLHNSIGLYLAGSRCFNLQIKGGWMVQSGVLLAVNVSASVGGGSISGTRFAPTGGGWDVYVNGAISGLLVSPIQIASDNYFSGQMTVVEQGSGLYSAAVLQGSSTGFFTANTPLDLRTCSKVTISSAPGFNLTVINGRIPGCELWVKNAGAGAVTIDAALMDTGAASNIAAGAHAIFMVLGFTASGKLTRML